MAKYISGKVKDLNVGISNYSENKTSVTVIGNVGIGTLVPTDQVGSGNTAVLAAGIVSAYQFYGDGSNITGVGATDKIVTESLDVLGISTLRGTLSVAGISTFNDSVRFPDDKKLHFGNIGGAFGDLQIWHDAGQHSYIRDQGSGDLRIYGSAVDIRDNAGTSSVARFSDDGVDVTGILNVAGVATITQDVKVGGALTVTGDTTIAGNLIVNGTQTVINSNSLEIADSQIVLNRDETGAPSQNAGIIIERGTSTNVSLRWAEGTDTWEYTNDGSTFKTIGSSSISAADGNLTTEEKIRLTDPNGGTDDVVLAAGNGLSIARSGDKITFTNSATDSDTTYSQSFVDSSNDCILRLSAGGSGSGNDDLKFVAGNNITLTPSGDDLTIASASTDTLDTVCDRGSTTDQNITTSGTLNDAAGNVREIVNNTKTGAYTLTANDVGELINTNSNVTIPSGVFSAGQGVTIYNNSSSNISIVRSSVTAYTVGTSTDSNKTLAQKGLATVMCVSANTFVVLGGGLS